MHIIVKEIASVGPSPFDKSLVNRVLTIAIPLITTPLPSILSTILVFVHSHSMFQTIFHLTLITILST